MSHLLNWSELFNANMRQILASWSWLRLEIASGQCWLHSITCWMICWSKSIWPKPRVPGEHQNSWDWWMFIHVYPLRMINGILRHWSMMIHGHFKNKRPVRSIFGCAFSRIAASGFSTPEAPDKTSCWFQHVSTNLKNAAHQSGSCS